VFLVASAQLLDHVVDQRVLNIHQDGNRGIHFGNLLDAQYRGHEVTVSTTIFATDFDPHQLQKKLKRLKTLSICDRRTPLLNNMSTTDCLNFPSDSISLTCGAICSLAKRATTTQIKTTETKCYSAFHLPVSFITNSSSLRVVKGKWLVERSMFSLVCCNLIAPLNNCRTTVLLT
jgi:hypothetical protein